MRSKRFLIALLASVMLIAMPQAAFADENDDQPEVVANAERTVLLYMCGSDLETNGSMATHNLKQILGSSFSSDEDINFIVMTGGAWRWQLDNDKNSENDNDYLVFPEGVNVPEDAVLVPDPDDPQAEWKPVYKTGSISNVYNQIWEARGADAQLKNGENWEADPNAGKLVLRDGDGLTGAEGTAVKGEDELMSDPDTLKAFINYGVANYPAEKYDLILWDHAGGPAGGYAADEHFDSSKEGAKLEDAQMYFSEVVDALSHNELTSPEDPAEAGKFDFIDFDACLQNSVELSLAMADFTDTYIASAESEPGYGQDYSGWLNLIGQTPDMDAYSVGKKIVDDFYNFYQNGDGMGQDGTLAVVNLKKLMESDFIEYLSEMTDLLEQEAFEGQFYDEITAALDSIQYGQFMNYYDLGNFASTISVVHTELSQDELDQETIKTDNVYSSAKVTQNINGILQDEDIIYACGTNGILRQGKLFRSTDGTIKMGPLNSSGMYIFFATPDAVDKTVYLFHYKEEVRKVLANMQENDPRRKFLESYMDMLADYSLITATARSVNWLINEEKVDRKEIDYDKVRENWKPGKDWGDWALYVGELFEMRSEGESAEAKAWLDKIAKQQAEEALSIENVSAKKVKTKEGTGYKINIKDIKDRAIRNIQREIGIDYVAAEEEIKKRVEEEELRDRIRHAMYYNAGVVEGRITDDDIDMTSASAEEIIRWYNRNEVDWEIDAPEPFWYAVKDAEGNLHAVAINEEAPDAYYVGGEILLAGDERVPMLLKFSKGDDALHLTELIFNTADGMRPIKVTDLTSTYEISLSMIVTFSNFGRRSTYFLPTSKTTFRLNAENAKDVTLEYTDIEKLIDIGDIGDTDGDKEVYHSRFTVNDIYGNYVNINEIINNTDETVISIDLARVRHKVYSGEKQVPELVYMGETLKEGEDYTWDFYNEPNQGLTEAGNYRLRFKGIGKFTGYAVRVFSIVREEDEAQAMVDQAEEELQLANEAFADVINSGNQSRLKEVYERLVNAQNALSDAEKVLNDTKDLIAREKQEELEKRINELDKQIQNLNSELAKAKAVDISHYEVTIPAAVAYTGKALKPAVKVSGLDSSAYSVTYSNNKKVGTAKVVIEAKGPSYTGKITKSFKINPKKAVISKVKAGRRKMTVTVKTKVAKTGGSFYQIRYRVKGTAKWKTKKTKKAKLTIKKLKKGKKYQVKVRACAKVGGKTYYGAWSKVKTTKKIK